MAACLAYEAATNAPVAAEAMRPTIPLPADVLVINAGDVLPLELALGDGLRAPTTLRVTLHRLVPSVHRARQSTATSSGAGAVAAAPRDAGGQGGGGRDAESHAPRSPWFDASVPFADTPPLAVLGDVCVDGGAGDEDRDADAGLAVRTARPHLVVPWHVALGCRHLACYVRVSVDAYAGAGPLVRRAGPVVVCGRPATCAALPPLSTELGVRATLPGGGGGGRVIVHPAYPRPLVLRRHVYDGTFSCDACGEELDATRVGAGGAWHDREFDLCAACACTPDWESVRVYRHARDPELLLVGNHPPAAAGADGAPSAGTGDAGGSSGPVKAPPSAHGLLVALRLQPGWETAAVHSLEGMLAAPTDRGRDVHVSALSRERLWANVVLHAREVGGALLGAVPE